MPKVLIVDDDADLLEMVSIVLHTYKMEVTCLDNGNDFFSTVTRSFPDIIVMDVFLGDADGRDLCRELKNSEGFASVPVLLYSAATITEGSIRHSQANGFLQKPFDISYLIAQIQKFLW